MKDWIKIIVMCVIVIVVLFLGYFLVNKYLITGGKKNKEDTSVNQKKDVYELGDDIVFKQLENVMFTSENDKRDFSKWKVLSQNRNYLNLYSVSDWGEIDIKNYYNEISQHRKIMSQYKVFSGYDEDFRLLGNNELELFSCNTFNMTCLNVPNWIGTSLTAVSSNGKYIIFKNNKMTLDNGSNKILYHPVIRILKDKIE